MQSDCCDAQRQMIYQVEQMRQLHPCMGTGTDFFERPLLVMLAGAKGDAGQVEVNVKVMNGKTIVSDTQETIAWQAHPEDVAGARNAIARTSLVEYAAIGMACLIIPTYCDGRQLLEVTRRGDRADYWLGYHPGEKVALLEVGGTEKRSIQVLLNEKTNQLAGNPYGVDGYVVVARFESFEVILSQNRCGQ